MTALRYRPASAGGWLAIVDGTRALVVGPGGWNLADAAAGAIGGERGFEAAVDLVTRDGFASIPDFVLLEWSDDSVRTLLRGPVTLTVTDRSGEHEQGGSGLSTWTERGFADVTAARIEIDGAEASELQNLVLRSGVAPFASGHLDFAMGRAGAMSAPDEPQARTPEPGAEGSSDGSPSSTVAAPVEETRVPSSTPADGIEGLTGTVLRPPSTSAIAADTIVAPIAATSDSLEKKTDDAPLGDHDGQTVLSSDIAKLRAGRGAHEHTVAPVTEPTAAPRLFLELADGSREMLDRPVLVGRSPSVRQVSGERMPRLVTVGNGDQDISRNHAQITVEGGTIVVTDLHSRNGTIVVLPGRSPQKLRAGEPTSVIAGTVVDLGGGITLTVGED